MHEALPPPSKGGGGGQDGDIGTIALDSGRSCWSLSNITAALMQQLNEKNIFAKGDARNVEKFVIKFVF